MDFSVCLHGFVRSVHVNLHETNDAEHEHDSKYDAFHGPPQGYSRTMIEGHRSERRGISTRQGMSPWGQQRKSSVGFGMSVVGGKADFNLGRLEVCF